ncbi:unnamed protein product, partial [Heterosigma akashiwo]
KNPWNLAHAQRSPDWMRWREAVADEYDSLLRHNVWELVDKPSGANIGYTRNGYDSCVYSKVSSTGEKILISVYVDDIVLASSDKSELSRIMKAISLGYDVSDMGEIESILGIKVQRDRAARTITLSQHNFIEEACEKFQVRSYEPVTNPVNIGIDVNINTDTSRRLSTFEAKKFRSLVGTVNWLALWTFPEVAYSIHTLSKRFTSPSANCLAASYHLLRYLWWSEDKGVTLGGPLSLTAYADADFCSERHKGSSRSGFAIFLGFSPIIWSSRMQHCVTRNTTEAEYVSLRNAVTNVMWLKRLLESLGYKQGCVPIYEDNKACISWANDETVSKSARHIHVSYHYTRK